MSLLRDVVSYLEGRGLASALVGGAALALHGIARATENFDLLALDRAPLDRAFWTEWKNPGRPEILSGDPEDSLAGMARWVVGETMLDLVIGKDEWMRPILARRAWIEVAGEAIPVVEAADLVLLKLFAGGPQDLLDARLLLAGDPSGLRTKITERLDSLPSSLRARWHATAV